MEFEYIIIPIIFIIYIYIYFYFFNNKTKLIANIFLLPNYYLYTWGMKFSGIISRFISQYLYKKIIYLEDGFIRSLETFSSKLPFSIYIDKKSIYYNNHKTNDLRSFLYHNLTHLEYERVVALKNLWIRARITKYNTIIESKPPNKPYILVVDQTLGDLSIKFGSANHNNFNVMLRWALANWPNHKILVRIHPDVTSGKKRGYLTNLNQSNSRIIYSSDGLSPCLLLEKCEAICTVTSQLGFEGLLWDKPTYVFGKPFYGGLGLTFDYYSNFTNNNNTVCDIYQLIFSSLIRCSRYKLPGSQNNCEIEDLILWILNQKNKINRYPIKKPIYSMGLTPYKFVQIKRYIPFIRRINLVKLVSKHYKNITLATWGMDHYKTKFDNSISRVYLEDGFIRSVGLGAKLIESSSLNIDTKALYYDGSTESDLEYLLKFYDSRNIDKDKAQSIIKQIVSKSVTKYNLDENNWKPNNINHKKDIVLVIGQVPADASLKLGIPLDSPIKTNIQLLSECRKKYPESWIIFKPHPDLTNHLRYSNENEHFFRDICDEYLDDVSITCLFKYVNRVCVLTSLAGFEALIRGIPVTTFGVPFYAGWGLTDDYLSGHSWISRRSNYPINLERLVYLTLFVYPQYRSLKDNSILTVHETIDQLQEKKVNMYYTNDLFKSFITRLTYIKDILFNNLLLK